MFYLEWCKDDGRYSWVTISPVIHDSVFSTLVWYADRSPGVRSRRVRVAPKEAKPVIFRLRGILPHELEAMVAEQVVLIGEYWPNDPEENYRGVTLVHNHPGRWRQDLVPSSTRVFSLTIKREMLWLEHVADIKAPEL
jgi:hypothetical protein